MIVLTHLQQHKSKPLLGLPSCNLHRTEAGGFLLDFFGFFAFRLWSGGTLVIIGSLYWLLLGDFLSQLLQSLLVFPDHLGAELDLVLIGFGLFVVRRWTFLVKNTFLEIYFFLKTLFILLCKGSPKVFLKQLSGLPKVFGNFFPGFLNLF